MAPVTLSITSSQHRILMSHLFPEDGCEAVAFALCGRCQGSKRHRLMVHRLFLVPYDNCSVRSPDRVTWPTDLLPPLLDDAEKHRWAVVKIHGHRGYDRFSSIDDISDRTLFPSICSWVADTQPHASVILLDSGRLYGRVVSDNGEFTELACINVVGDDLPFWYSQFDQERAAPEFGKRIAQAFGAGTYQRLRKLRVAVIGCSGTGSPVIEQLARNCVGSLVLVDPAKMASKNLNRIVNSTMADAIAARRKVDIAKDAVLKMGLGSVDGFSQVWGRGIPKSLFL
jgi:ThiF family